MKTTNETTAPATPVVEPVTPAPEAPGGVSAEPVVEESTEDNAARIAQLVAEIDKSHRIAQFRQRVFLAALQGILASPNPSAGPEDAVKLAQAYADHAMRLEGTATT